MNRRQLIARLLGTAAAGVLAPLAKLLPVTPVVAQSETLTSLIPAFYAALDKVSRELIGFQPAFAAIVRSDVANSRPDEESDFDLG